MGKYNGAVITTAGQNLIAQAIAESKTVTFTTAQASSHVYPSSTNFEALTALTDVEKTVDINYAGVYSDTTIQISARFDNDGVDTAFLINTLGFFAQLGTDTPILFAVSTAVTPDQMPVFDADNPSAFIYNMQITVQNADSITVTVNPAGTVTIEQLNIITNDIYGKIGNLENLMTDNKTSLVNAVNEIDGHADIVQAQVSNSGDAYSASKAYAVGDLVIYNNKLYRCITACSAGSWATNQSCFVADTLTRVVSAFNSGFIKTAIIRCDVTPTVAAGYTDFPYSTSFNISIDFPYTRLLSICYTHTITENVNGNITIVNPYFAWGDSSNYESDITKLGSRALPKNWKIASETNNNCHVYFTIMYI